MGADTETQIQEKDVNAIVRGLAAAGRAIPKLIDWIRKNILVLGLLGWGGIGSIGTVTKTSSHGKAIHVAMDSVLIIAKEDHLLNVETAEKVRILYGSFRKLRGGQAAMDGFLIDQENWRKKIIQDSINRALYGPLPTIHAPAPRNYVSTNPPRRPQ